MDGIDTNDPMKFGVPRVRFDVKPYTNKPPILYCVTQVYNNNLLVIKKDIYSRELLLLTYGYDKKKKML